MPLDNLISPTGNRRISRDNTPMVIVAYDVRGQQYIGDVGSPDIGFIDVPSIGTIREMTPIMLRVVLYDDPRRY